MDEGTRGTSFIRKSLKVDEHGNILFNLYTWKGVEKFAMHKRLFAEMVHEFVEAELGGEMK